MYVTEYKNILFDFRHFYTVYTVLLLMQFITVCLYSIVVLAVHYFVFYAVLLFMQYITVCFIQYGCSCSALLCILCSIIVYAVHHCMLHTVAYIMCRQERV